MPLRDDLNGAVDHLDGRLVVDGVRRTPDLGGPPLASTRVFSGIISWPRCGKIEKSTTPSVRSSGADGHSTKSSPIRGVITMLPALTPTQTVSGSDGRRSLPAVGGG